MSPDALTPVRVLVWSEGSESGEVYERGIRCAVADHLRKQADLVVRTGTLDDPGQGVREAGLRCCDTLVWWSHVRDAELADEAAERVVRRVDAGMGFVALHSAHRSKPLTRLLAASGRIAGTEIHGGSEQVQVLLPDHPIARGVTDFAIEREELWREPFDVPEPEEHVFRSSFPDHNATFQIGGGGWTRGRGRIFYFRPGHETYPTYFDPNVLRVIENAVRWTARRI